MKKDIGTLRKSQKCFIKFIVYKDARVGFSFHVT